MTDLNDRLDDIFGDNLADPTFSTPKRLPQDEASVRIREMTFSETCQSCRGTGRFISYSGRALGPCYKCKGNGHKTFATSPEVRAQARQRTAVAKASVVADHQAELTWLNATLARRDRLPEGYATMLEGAQTRLLGGHELSDGQMAVIVKGMARSAQWAAERVQKQADKGATLDVTAIRNALQNRKKVMIAEFTFSLAPNHGNNPGAIYVKDRGTYVGKIARDASTFLPGRDFDQSRLPALAEVMANPAEAVKADAARRAELLLKDPGMTIPCGCCGLTLSNPESIARGIGPICAGKWGF
jgi:hypothetical protein